MNRPALMSVPARRLALAAPLAGLALAAAVIPAGMASATQTPVLSWSPATAPGTYNYGTLGAAQTASTTFTLTNSGGSASSAIKAVTLSGSAAFTKTADTCTATSLGPKKPCTVTVSYAPTTSGQSDSATLTATGQNASANLALLGASASAAKITGVSIFYVDTGYGLQSAAVTGTGFLPNARITFTVTVAVDAGDSANTLNNPPYVYTDTTGAFNSGTDPATTNTWIGLGCPANTVTVTATDGTNTATGTFITPAC